MEEVRNKILAVLDANGGRTDWNTVKNVLDFREQQQMPQAIKSLKADGVAQAQNRMTENGIVFEVFRLSGGGGGA